MEDVPWMAWMAWTPASACFFGFVLRYVVPGSPVLLEAVEPLPELA